MANKSRSPSKDVFLRMPLDLYQACKSCRHIEHKDSMTAWINDILKSYLKYKGFTFEQKIKLEPEPFDEKPAETVSEMLTSVKQFGPTPGAWDNLPAWNNED